MKSSVWRASALKTTEVIDFLIKSVSTLELDAVCVYYQRADRLVLADQKIASLHVAIQEGERKIKRITSRIAEAQPSKRIDGVPPPVEGVQHGTVYWRYAFLGFCPSYHWDQR